MMKSEHIEKADALNAEGRYQQAAAECALGLEDLPNDSQEKAQALLTLGRLYDKLNHRDRIECLRKAVEVSKVAFGEKHDKTAEAMSALGVALSARGDYEEADEIVEEATKLRLQASGVDTEQAADAYADLGLMQMYQGRLGEAETTLSRAMGIRSRNPGKGHPAYAVSLRHMASLRNAEGKLSLSEPLLVQSVDILERKYGKNHPEVATSLDLLASQQFERQRPMEAEKNWKRVRDLLAKALPEEHPQRIAVLSHLAACALVLRSPEEAIELYDQAVQLSDSADEDDSVVKLDAVLGLGLTYLRANQFALAEPHVKRGLKMIGNLSDREMRMEKLLIDKLLTCYVFQGKFGDALRLLPDSLRAKHTRDFTETMDMLYQIANVIRKAIGKEPLK